jgi:hypothetical protein
MGESSSSDRVQEAKVSSGRVLEEEVIDKENNSNTYTHKKNEKYIYVLLLHFHAAQCNQNTDALRYSQDNLNGTARFEL